MLDRPMRFICMCSCGSVQANEKHEHVLQAAQVGFFLLQHSTTYNSTMANLVTYSWVVKPTLTPDQLLVGNFNGCSKPGEFKFLASTR